jgi:transcription antitermination factor NusB
MLYQWDVTRAPMDEVAASFWRVRSGADDMKAMAERLARGAQEYVGRLDGLIAEAATNWRIDRIAAVDRNLLRVAAYELDMERETPSSVVIDEAVEIAKRFGEADSPSFVNGVLDAIRRMVRGEERPSRRDKA